MLYNVPPDEGLILKIREKKELSKRLYISVLPSIFLMIFMYFFSAALILLLSVMGVGEVDIYRLFSNPAITDFMGFLISVFCFSAPFVIAAKLGGYGIGAIVPLGKPKKGRALPYYLLGLGFCSFANIISSYADSFFSFLGFEYNMPASQFPEGLWGFMLSVLCVAVEPGLMEEFAFRGVVQGVLRRYGSGFAIIVSSAFFGLMHGNFVQIPFAFLVGIILGIIREKTGTMWIACAVHFSNNLISVVLDYIPADNAMDINLIYVLYLAVALLAGIVGILMLVKKGESFSSEKSELAYTEYTRAAGEVTYQKREITRPCPLTEREKYRAVALNPAVIIFVCLCLLQAVQYLF